MTKIQYTPAQSEIIKALMAAGCGIVKRETPKDEAPAIGALPGLPSAKAVQSILSLQEGRPEPSLGLLLSMVAVEFRIPIPGLRSARRHKATVRARQAYFFIAKELTTRSLQQIGRAAGNKDHSTVLHGINKVAARREAFEPELSAILKRFQKDEAP